MYLYWFPEEAFESARKTLADEGYELAVTLLTPCQVLRASGKRVVYAPPQIWSRICVRQGSWYRESPRAGHTMLVSEEKLPDAYQEHLDAEIAETEFIPESLPSAADLQELVDSPEYREGKPKEWEEKGILDAFMFKVLFSLTRFWGWGDNLRKHWLSHRAHHANFLARRFTAEVDGEKVPYSIAENAGICSSCVETFNVIEPASRKLVRGCPGAVTFGGAERDAYLDIKPVRRATSLQA